MTHMNLLSNYSFWPICISAYHTPIWKLIQNSFNVTHITFYQSIVFGQSAKLSVHRMMVMGVFFDSHILVYHDILPLIPDLSGTRQWGNHFKVKISGNKRG